MPWPLEQALTEHRGVAEPELCLALRRGERLLQPGGLPDDAHPTSTAAGSRLDEQRVADRLRASLRQRRNVHAGCDSLGLELVPSQPERRSRRPDPDEPGTRDRLGESSTLREEAIARMNGVSSRCARRAQMFIWVEVGGHLDRHVRRARMQRSAVVCGHDRNGADAQSPARAEHAEGDLSAVCDEERFDRHGTRTLRRRHVRSS